MKKYIFIFTACLLSALLPIGCSSGNDKKTPEGDTSVQTLARDDDSKDYSSVEFRSEEEVKAFLNFKKFEDGHSYIAFNGKGGVVDGEAFTTTKVEVKSAKEVLLSINVPKMNIAGNYILKVTDSEVTLEDEKTHNIYKLIENED